MRPIPFLTRVLPVAALLAGLGACSSGGNDGIGPIAPRVGDSYALTSGNRVISFNRATPGTAGTAFAITGVGAGETLVGFDFRPADGLLYAVTIAGTTGKLYTVNTATGVATAGMTLVVDPADTSTPYTGLSGAAFGVDFNPVPDRLRVVSDTGQNLRINVANGLTTTDTALTGPGAGGVSAVAYTNSFSNACRTAIYYIDTTERLLLTATGNPNDGVTVAVGAGLGPMAANSISAFEIASTSETDNTAFAALTIGTTPTLFTIDLATGVATSRGAIGGAAGVGEQVLGLAMAPPATLPASLAAGELYGASADNRLVTFNRGAPGKLCTNVLITGLATGESVAGLDYRPSTGALHALGNAAGTGRLLTLDPATGAVTTAIGLSQPLTGASFGMDFNPTGPVALRIVSDTGQNLRVTDIATGATTADTALTFGGAASGATAAAYTNSVQGTGSTTLYVIDPTTDQLLVQGAVTPPGPNGGVLTAQGAVLGTDFTSVNAFDIDGRDNVALLAGSVGAATVSSLYTVDLTAGTATVLPGGAIGAASGLTTQIVGLTRPTPTTTVFGLTNANALVQLALTDPTLVTPVGAVTGLGAESLVGIDFRPNTRVLYGVGDGGGLFTIDPATAAATRVALSADPMDLGTDGTLPFAALSGTAFGVDFNPAPASVPLRVVSDTEQNLRVTNPVTGTTFTDATLMRSPAGPPAPDVHAAAYANSVTPNPATTALYVIDAATGSLMLQGANPAVAGMCPLTTGNPNCGVLTAVGALSATDSYSTVSGFDIAGGANGIALAVLQRTVPVAEAASRLYRINLATGAATEVAPGGLVGSVPLRGLAVRVQ